MGYFNKLIEHHDNFLQKVNKFTIGTLSFIFGTVTTLFYTILVIIFSTPANFLRIGKSRVTQGFFKELKNIVSRSYPGNLKDYVSMEMDESPYWFQPICWFPIFAFGIEFLGYIFKNENYSSNLSIVLFSGLYILYLLLTVPLTLLFSPLFWAFFCLLFFILKLTVYFILLFFVLFLRISFISLFFLLSFLTFIISFLPLTALKLLYPLWLFALKEKKSEIKFMLLISTLFSFTKLSSFYFWISFSLNIFSFVLDFDFEPNSLFKRTYCIFLKSVLNETDFDKYLFSSSYKMLSCNEFYPSVSVQHSKKILFFGDENLRILSNEIPFDMESHEEKWEIKVGFIEITYFLDKSGSKEEASDIYIIDSPFSVKKVLKFKSKNGDLKNKKLKGLLIELSKSPEIGVLKCPPEQADGIVHALTPSEIIKNFYKNDFFGVFSIEKEDNFRFRVLGELHVTYLIRNLRLNSDLAIFLDKYCFHFFNSDRSDLICELLGLGRVNRKPSDVGNKKYKIFVSDLNVILTKCGRKKIRTAEVYPESETLKKLLPEIENFQSDSILLEEKRKRNIKTNNNRRTQQKMKNKKEQESGEIIFGNFESKGSFLNNFPKNAEVKELLKTSEQLIRKSNAKLMENLSSYSMKESDEIEKVNEKAKNSSKTGLKDYSREIRYYTNNIFEMDKSIRKANSEINKGLTSDRYKGMLLRRLENDKKSKESAMVELKNYEKLKDAGSEEINNVENKIQEISKNYREKTEDEISHFEFCKARPFIKILTKFRCNEIKNEDPPVALSNKFEVLFKESEKMYKEMIKERRKKAREEKRENNNKGKGKEVEKEEPKIEKGKGGRKKEKVEEEEEKKKENEKDGYIINLFNEIKEELSDSISQRILSLKEEKRIKEESKAENEEEKINLQLDLNKAFRVDKKQGRNKKRKVLSYGLEKSLHFLLSSYKVDLKVKGSYYSNIKGRTLSFDKNYIFNKFENNVEHDKSISKSSTLSFYSENKKNLYKNLMKVKKKEKMIEINDNVSENNKVKDEHLKAEIGKILDAWDKMDFSGRSCISKYMKIFKNYI